MVAERLPPGRPMAIHPVAGSEAMPLELSQPWSVSMLLKAPPCPGDAGALHVLAAAAGAARSTPPQPTANAPTAMSRPPSPLPIVFPFIGPPPDEPTRERSSSPPSMDPFLSRENDRSGPNRGERR